MYAGTTLGCVTKIPQRRDILVCATAVSNEVVDPLEDINLDKSTLNETQKKQLLTMLKEEKTTFASSPVDLGCLPDVEHSIGTGNSAPLRQPPYRTEMVKRKVLDSEIIKMQEAGVIRSSSSPWASPVVLVPKKDGSMRFCIDYRRLNAITQKDVFPLPLISEVLDSLNSAKYFSTLDLMSGYWQVKVKPEDIQKTAFTTHSGLWEFVRMPFGLTNAPGTFQRAMQAALTGLQPHIAMVYLDDILIHSETFEQHLKDIRVVLRRLQQYNLKLKGKKCNFACQEVAYLGHIISAEGLKPDPGKIAAIKEMPRPTDLTSL